jgi:hypothetical protein
MVPSSIPTSSSTNEQAAAALDAAHSTLCKLVLSLTYDEARVLMRIAMRLRIEFDDREPVPLQPGAVEYMQANRQSIEEDLVLLTWALIAAGRCT